jgi:uncharacterized membrane protein
MKKHFITGLIILMPVVLTLLILIFIIDFFTNPFLTVIENLLLHIKITHTLSPQAVTFISRIVVLSFLFFLILILGVIARWFFFRSIINLTNKILSKTPFVKTIFNITRDIAGAFVSHGEKKAFKKPVLIMFPSKKSFSVGFETGEIPPICQKHVKEPLTPVFVPTAPHPISGYLLMVKKKCVDNISMTNEEAIKFTVSCGIITPEDKEPIKTKDD